MRPAFLNAYRDKRVFVTGHTGFKGGWLSLWLEQLGAKVAGYSLSPPTSPSMFELCSVEGGLAHETGDIRDLDQLKQSIATFKPDIVFHLAAQPIVRQSYVDPLETVTTNIVGTANVLEAVRGLESACAVVVITSDKCYENRNWIWGYRENDPMGGHDPYSMSKGAAELLVASWRQSYFEQNDTVRLASARAGNVIGGGDWAQDRIVPDCVKAFCRGQTVELRNPEATRPWQHVLEPLGGYLLLGERLMAEGGEAFSSGWNFGPSADDVRPVLDLVQRMADAWGHGANISITDTPQPKEATLLALNCDKATGLLSWRPTWDLEMLVAMTVDWYKAWQNEPESLRQLTLSQITQFETNMSSRFIGES